MASPPLIEIVDDDDDVRRMLVRVVEMLGYRARSHENALAYLAAAPADDAAAMVLDVRMPGMSGIELKAHLDQIGRHLPVIFISGESLPSEIASPQARQAVAFLWKPFKLDQLRQALEKALAPNAG